MKQQKNKTSYALSTRAIHGKKMYPYTGAVATPIYQTSNFRFKNSDDAIRYADGDESVYVYTRYHNPTTTEAEEKLCAIFNAEASVVFSSGMAAISTALLSFAGAGEEIISNAQLYGGTYRLFRDVFPRYGIAVKNFPSVAAERVAQLITKKTRIVYFETPTNPQLELVDIALLLSIVQEKEKKLGTRIITIIDNTFATVINQQPFVYGVDIIMESATKYLGGHSDILAGIIVGKKELIAQVQFMAQYLGGCIDPFASFLLLRSLKTFPLRVREQCTNALAFATALEKNANIARVVYPGLPSFPQYALAQKQMAPGFGGIVTLEVKGGLKKAIRVADNLNVAVNAMSLGGMETLVSIPVLSSHIKMSDEELRQCNVTKGMLRVSLGAENVQDVIEDFERAMSR
jgi:methionine-gamma-lyase